MIPALGKIGISELVVTDADSVSLGVDCGCVSVCGAVSTVVGSDVCVCL